VELLERRDEVASLLRLVDAARHGEGGIALLRGEAGIGKSSVATVLASAVADDVRVLWGWCDNLTVPRPLGPFRDMATTEAELADALSAEDQGLARQRVLEFLSTGRPTVVVVEDAHWADSATLDLLTLVARRVGVSRTLLVLTFRDVPSDHPLRAVLGALPVRSVVNVPLPPLSREAVAVLAGGRADVDDLHARTGGNPFLVTALLGSPGDGVPVTVADVVGATVAQLRAPERRLVELVSVVRGPVRAELVEGVEPTGMASFGAVEQVGLLRMSGGALSFRHELARAAVEEDLAQPRRRELHLRVLEVGQRLGLSAASLAHHARQADDVESMVRLLPTAARQAAARWSHREALTHLEALEPLLPGMPDAEQAELYELWAAEEEAATGRGRGRAMAALALRRRLCDDRALGSALVRASRSVWTDGDFIEAGALAREAVAVLAEVGGDDLALAYAQAARTAVQNYQPEQADEYAEGALALAAPGGRARALALTVAGLSRNLYSYPQGSPLLVEAAEVADGLALDWEAQRARANHIETALFAKDLSRARSLNDTQPARPDADSAATRWQSWTRARIDVAAGDYPSAEPAIRAVVEGSDTPASLRWHAEASLAELLVRRGDTAAAELLDRLRVRVRREGQVQDRVDVATLSAQHRWLFRRTDGAEAAEDLEILREAGADAPPWVTGQLALWLWLGRDLDAVPDRAPPPVRWLADGDWVRAATWFDERGLPFERAVALSCGGVDARLEALGVAQRLGALALAARLRGELRASGVTGIPRGPRRATSGNGLGLTPRQVEVLGLVADGLTNVEIADRLFLSLRTVENHVSAILTALTVTSRGEAVAVARSRGVLP
jgi:DNA-binding CsgD family transcriptional regulator